MYNSLGAAIIDDGRFDFDVYIKKACPMMLVEDTIEKKATTSNNNTNFLLFFHTLLKKIKERNVKFTNCMAISF